MSPSDPLGLCPACGVHLDAAHRSAMASQDLELMLAGAVEELDAIAVALGLPPKTNGDRLLQEVVQRTRLAEQVRAADLVSSSPQGPVERFAVAMLYAAGHYLQAVPQEVHPDRGPPLAALRALDPIAWREVAQTPAERRFCRALDAAVRFTWAVEWSSPRIGLSLGSTDPLAEAAWYGVAIAAGGTPPWHALQSLIDGAPPDLRVPLAGCFLRHRPPDPFWSVVLAR